VWSCLERRGQPKQWSGATFLPAHERSEFALATLIHELPLYGVLRSFGVVPAGHHPLS
jgi:hypothetical protein